jgi:hypothetical protein
MPTKAPQTGMVPLCARKDSPGAIERLCRAKARYYDAGKNSNRESATFSARWALTISGTKSPDAVSKRDARLTPGALRSYFRLTPTVI